MNGNVVRVPKPGRSAYNPNRPLSRNTLVESQVKHFAEADRNLPPEFQTGVDPESIRTEGQAGDFIRKVTEAIHLSGGRTAAKVQRAG